MTDRKERQRSRLILRFAVLGSLLVHAIGIVLWGVATDRFVVLRPLPHGTPPPDIVVSISHATTISKRARPEPQQRPQQAARRSVQSARAAVAAPPQAIAPAIPARPSLEPPHALREIVKEQPKLERNPPRTMHETPSPPPTPIFTPPPPTPTPPAPTPRPARPQLSRAQLAHIGKDIQQTLSQLRREDEALAVQATAPPSAPKRIRVQMLGADSDLRHGQGVYYPIKSWKDDGYNYYYVSYEFVYADGMTESGGVPWPIRFLPAHDPFVHPELAAPGESPLAGPLPGWTLPHGEKIGKVLYLAFPGLPGAAQ